MSYVDHQIRKLKFYTRFPNAQLTTITKALEEKRWFTCVVLIGDYVDGHNDIISPELVEELADEWITNLAGKQLGIQHKDFSRQLLYIGHWFTIDGGVFDGLIAPPNSWVSRLKVLDDEIWRRIKAGELTGLSPGGKFDVQPLT